MTINDLFTLGNKYRQEGNIPLAVQLWQDCIKNDPFYGPAHVNMADFCRTQNNLVGEKQHLNQFLDCPVTGRTIAIVQQTTVRLQEIDKLMQAPQAPK